ncbi:MAG: YggU family protein [Anaerolineae bacterium]|nr:YggU family protein [Anaerolineae bacterium]NIN95304.1 YggU family protein [Anaerolineae bacterium]NIQ78269.1 YggU family protein [Anaerolineae bacterium]
MESKPGDSISFHDRERDPSGAEEDAAVFTVRVVPRASSNVIVGMDGEMLKVKVTASPKKGEANHALVKLLAKVLGVRKNQVEILSGHTARRKVVRVEGLRKSAVLQRIHDQ